MFRKIHSNRNPGDTLWSSFSTEFAVYTSKLKSRFHLLLQAYPKQVFAIMVLLILGSIPFTLKTRNPAKPPKAIAASTSVAQPVQNGFSQILTQAEALRENIRLKEEITSILAKDSLNHKDSAQLEKAIDRFHQLTIKTNPHGQR